MTLWRRHGEPNLEAPHPPQRSNVHVLGSDEELRDALRRSAQAERAAIDRLRTRADRYEALIASAPITDIRSKREPLNNDVTDEQIQPA